VGLKLGHFIKSKDCLDLKFEKEKERIARDEPEKLKDLPRFKCRRCGIGLRCHALLNDDPSLCMGCGACYQFPCPADALSFEGIGFADSTYINELISIESQLPPLKGAA
jgi:TPP-dependent indolepyruvate ferredoxin oxidoreductase alpha subunit